jgi:hypothetical protein
MILNLYAWFARPGIYGRAELECDRASPGGKTCFCARSCWIGQAYILDMHQKGTIPSIHVWSIRATAYAHPWPMGHEVDVTCACTCGTSSTHCLPRDARCSQLSLTLLATARIDRATYHRLHNTNHQVEVLGQFDGGGRPGFVPQEMGVWDNDCLEIPRTHHKHPPRLYMDYLCYFDCVPIGRLVSCDNYWERYVAEQVLRWYISII